MCLSRRETFWRMKRSAASTICGGAVVLFEEQDLCAGVVRLKVQQHIRAGGAEAVDALILVADEKQVPCLAPASSETTACWMREVSQPRPRRSSDSAPEIRAGSPGPAAGCAGHRPSGRHSPSAWHCAAPAADRRGKAQGSSRAPSTAGPAPPCPASDFFA